MQKRNSIDFYFKPTTKPVENKQKKNWEFNSSKRSSSEVIDLEVKSSFATGKKKLKKSIKNSKKKNECSSDDDCIFLEEIKLPVNSEKNKDISTVEINLNEKNKNSILIENYNNSKADDSTILFEKDPVLKNLNLDCQKNHSLNCVENLVIQKNDLVLSTKNYNTKSDNSSEIESEYVNKIETENFKKNETKTIDKVNLDKANEIEFENIDQNETDNLNSFCSDNENSSKILESSNFDFSKFFSTSKKNEDISNDTSLISGINFDEDIIEDSEITQTSEITENSKTTEIAKFNVSKFYRDHFVKIIESVINDDLDKNAFSSEDNEIINKFFSLSNSSQTLFIRLFFRKNQWIKKSSIVYNDITKNLEVYIDELIDNNFLLDSNHIFNLEEGLNVLDLNELKDYGKKLKIASLPSNKQKIIANILNYLRKSKKLSFIKSNVSLEDSALIYIKNFLCKKCFKINFNIFKLFFGVILIYYPPMIIDRGLNNFLSNIFFELYNDQEKETESTYPEYVVNKKTKIFSKPSDLKFLIEASILESNACELNQTKNKSTKLLKILEEAKQLFEDYLSVNSEIDKKLPIFLRKLTAGQKLIRCMNFCLDSIEHAKFYKETNKYLEYILDQDVYSLASRGFLYSRLIKNYEIYCKDDLKAFQLCQKSISDSYVRGALRLEILKRGVKLSKKLKIEDQNFILEDFIKPEVTIFANTLKATIDNRKNIFCEKNNQGGHDIYKVEQIALNHYLRSCNFTNGLHSENTLFNTLYYLIFYEIIFIQKENLDDIYRYKSQKLPLDFNSDDFYNFRKEEFEKKFLDLSKEDNSKISDLIEQNYQKLKNIKSTYNINSIEIDHLKEIVSCLNINSLIEICKRLAQNNRISRSGFPDLIVWNYEEKRIKAVEVKGPNDELSDKQILWIDYMNKCGLETEVCRVKTK